MKHMRRYNYIDGIMVWLLKITDQHLQVPIFVTQVWSIQLVFCMLFIEYMSDDIFRNRDSVRVRHSPRWFAAGFVVIKVAGCSVYRLYLDWWRCISYLQRLSPRWLVARSVWVGGDGVQSLLKQNQHAVHNAHDQMGRLPEFLHCGNVWLFDGLKHSVYMVSKFAYEYLLFMFCWISIKTKRHHACKTRQMEIAYHRLILINEIARVFLISL